MHVIIASVLVVVSLAQNPSLPKEPVKKENPTATESNCATRQKTEGTPPVVSATSDLYQTERYNQEKYNCYPPNAGTYKVKVVEVPPDYWVRMYVGITGFLALLNVIGLVFVWNQRKIIQGQLTEMQGARKQTDDIIKQATKQTKISIESHFLNEHMVKLEYRAWVQIKENKSTVNQNNHLLDADVTVENTGRTPAKKVHIRLCREEVESGESPTYSYDEDQTMAAQTAIPPKYPLRLDFGKNFRVDLDQIDRKNVNLFIHGIVTYDDVFGQHHWMTFCFIFEPDTQSFRAYEEHNETDD